MRHLELTADRATLDAGLQRMAENEYPGRWMALGINTVGNLALQAYALTGRSSGSRNRIFEEDADGIRTVAPGKTAAEMAAEPNANLIYYRAMRDVGGMHVVSNGAQTEPVLWDLL
jgi:IMP cyclohydrolase